MEEEDKEKKTKEKEEEIREIRNYKKMEKIGNKIIICDFFNFLVANDKVFFG